jgi:hypothetical protein
MHPVEKIAYIIKAIGIITAAPLEPDNYNQKIPI